MTNQKPLKPKLLKPSHEMIAKQLLAAGAKTIPASVMRGVLREWAQEDEWARRMTRIIMKAIEKYGA